MNIFDTDYEIDRLNAQEELLWKAQESVYDSFLDGNEMVILDIGCSDGFKTVREFDRDNVKKVLGLDYAKEAVEKARKRYGNEKFCFETGNVEDESFENRLDELINKYNIEAFDIIHLSLVVLHLKNPVSLFKCLRKYLKKGGRIIIVEADDDKAVLSPDDYYLRKYNSLLKIDPYMGNRECANNMYIWLNEAGYFNIHDTYVYAQGKDINTKKTMFDIYFSSLPVDFEDLCIDDPGNEEYRMAKDWLDENIDNIYEYLLHDTTVFSFGVSIFEGFVC
ncbi:MAG: class I SAM-dependent methyltransferase [Erysipelotrichaceae bacterium]